MVKLMLSYILILILPSVAFSSFYKAKIEQDFMTQYSAVISDSMSTLDSALTARVENLGLYAESIAAECSLTNFQQYKSDTREYLIIEMLLQKLLPALKHFAALNQDVQQSVLIHKNPVIPDVFYRVYLAEARVKAVEQSIASGEYAACGKRRLYQSELREMDTFHDAASGRAAQPKPVLSFYYPVESLFRDAVLGYLEFDIVPEKLFDRMIPLLTIEGSYMDICQKNGELVYSSERSPARLRIDAELEENAPPRMVEQDGTAYYQFVYSLPSVGLYCVSHLPTATVMSAQNDTINTYMLILALSFLVSLAVIYGIARMLSHNLIWLGRRVNEISRGDLNVDTRRPGKDEVSDLGEMIYAMQAHIRELLDKTIQLGISEREAVYAGLVNQLKPHFMCNALNTLRIRASKQGAPHIAGALGLVINFFRYNMSDTDLFVTARKELENAVDYVSIHNLMAGEAEGEIILNVLYENLDAQGLERCYVLKYILQPMLENAIKHGFSEAVDHPEIVITLALEGRRLKVTVEDNGSGMTAERLDEINRLIHAGGERCDVGKTTSIGLENLYHRLRIHFGAQADLRVDSYVKIGTKVSIEMPLCESGEGSRYEHTDH